MSSIKVIVLSKYIEPSVENIIINMETIIYMIFKFLLLRFFLKLKKINRLSIPINVINIGIEILSGKTFNISNNNIKIVLIVNVITHNILLIFLILFHFL